MNSKKEKGRPSTEYRYIYVDRRKQVRCPTIITEEIIQERGKRIKKQVGERCNFLLWKGEVPITPLEIKCRICGKILSYQKFI